LTAARLGQIYEKWTDSGFAREPKSGTTLHSSGFYVYEMQFTSHIMMMIEAIVQEYVFLRFLIIQKTTTFYVCFYVIQISE